MEVKVQSLVPFQVRLRNKVPHADIHPEEIIDILLDTTPVHREPDNYNETIVYQARDTHFIMPHLSAQNQTPKEIGKQHNKKKSLGNITIPAVLPEVHQHIPKRAFISGALANVFWRAIPVDDLRKHPLYQPLPIFPENVSEATISAHDIPLFRQDSNQWSVLHEGRMTTSIAAATAGMYEEANARYLGIPQSLSGHSRSQQARARLLIAPVVDLRVLLHLDGKAVENKSKSIEAEIWKQSTPNSIFPYTYQPRKSRTPKRGYSTASSARLAWGSAQEATAILVAVNYCSTINATVAEVGMCPLEIVSDLPAQIQAWITDKSLPLIGASPDGLIFFDNGDINVLEVKCSSPFVDMTRDRKGGKSKGNHTMFIRQGSQSFVSNGVPTWHIPQLQLEILCAGPRCSGATLVALTANDGATIYRIQRDNDYILSLLKWMREFYVLYCDKRLPQSLNPSFFNIETPGYLEFLNSTKLIASEATVVAKINQKDVQRSSQNTHYFT